MKRTSIRDVAKAAGVAPITVSEILRNRGKYAEATIARVKAVAKELNYIPHPGIKTMMQRVGENRASDRKWTAIAILHDEHYLEKIEINQGLKACHEGLRIRAEELGFSLQTFKYDSGRSAGNKASTLPAVLRVIYSRGIRGILLPQRTFEHDPFPIDPDLWGKFHVTALTPIGKQIAFHTCCTDEFYNTKLAFEQLWQRGYKRIGLYILRHLDLRHQGKITGGYLSSQWQHAQELTIPPLVSNRWEKPLFERWLKEHNPDAIIGFTEELIDWMKQLDYRIPEDKGFAILATEEAGPVSGIINPQAEIGKSAINLLYALMQQNILGASPNPIVYQVNGTWNAGETAAAMK